MECESHASAHGRLIAVGFRFLARIASLLRQVKANRSPRTLRICETLSLGERRLLLVVQVERRRFLIGATNQSIALLDRLDERSSGSTQAGATTSLDRSWRGIH